MLQAQWIFALWTLLKALDVSDRASNLALAVCIFSGFAFLNTLYVWPKLMAASYLLAAMAILIPNGPDALHRIHRVAAAVLAGGLAAFSFLSHGSSMFGILGVFLTLICLRRHLDYKFFGLFLITAATLYLPWFLYQRLYDPPGDRLLKWHLAGVTALDSRTFSRTLIDAYTEVSPGQILVYKLENVKTLAAHEMDYGRKLVRLAWQFTRQGFRETEALTEAASDLRGYLFFYLAPNMGALALASFAFLIRHKKSAWSAEWKAAALLFSYVILTLAIWCLLMFTPGSTVIHQGTYTVVLLAYAGSILALWHVDPKLAVVIGAIQIGINVLLYWLLLYRFPGSGPVRYATLALCWICVIGICIQLKELAGHGVDNKPTINVCSSPALKDTVGRQGTLLHDTSPELI